MKYSILIVDDNLTNLKLAASVLSPYYKLMMADNGEKAIKIAESKMPELILLDIQMPGLSGLDVCKILKQNEKTEGIPIIFLTAFSNPDSIVKGFEAGGQDYISKPFNAVELLLRIKNQLELFSNRKLLKGLNEHLEEEVQQRTIELNNALNEKAALYEKLEQKHLQLQQISSRFLNVQEDEKRNIARELHDEIGQTLSALKLNLHSIKKFNTEEIPLKRLSQSMELLDQLLKQVRSISLSLHPSVLDDLGFSAAIDWLFERLNFGANVKIESVINVPDSHLDKFSRPLFRILQEALTNIRKYSCADEINVKLVYEDNNICLYVSDNGIGFNVSLAFQKALSGKSLGLLSMRERAELIGGNLIITSSPGKGATIKILLARNLLEL